MASPLYQLKELPKILDPRGNLTFIEGGAHLPFPIKRVFYLYDVPGGAERGGHALEECRQFIIAISGSFDVVLKNGLAKEKVHLNRSYYGIEIPPMTWRRLENLSSGSVCIALASEKYSEEDYYRDFDQYLDALKERRPSSGTQ